MTVPEATITALDGALGVVPPGSGDVAAAIAPSTGGPLNLPAAFARGPDIVTNFTAGELVELGGYLLKTPGRPAVVVRADADTDGAYGSVVTTGMTGLSVPTADTAVKPIDDYEAVVRFVVGGTVGAASPAITYQTSLDGGRTYSGVMSLGTATKITFADGGVAFDLTTSTVVAGDVFTCRTSGPRMVTQNLADALVALQGTALHWDFLVVGGVVDADMIIQLDAWAAALWALGLHKKVLCSARGPNVGETEAQYYAAMQALRTAAGTSLYVHVAAGCSKTASAVSGRKYRRPAAWPIAQRACSSVVSNPARYSLAQVAADGHGGPLPSDVKITDATGNPDEHDEWANPGLDDLHFMTLRTFPTPVDERGQVYINRPVSFAATGSDWDSWHRISLRNQAADALKPYLQKRLQKPIPVNARTGFILESEAIDIEEGAKQTLKDAIGEAVSPGGIFFSVARSDNLLANATLRTTARLVPLVYPDKVGCELGLLNPVRVTAV
jgi:hypothetical protein